MQKLYFINFKLYINKLYILIFILLKMDNGRIMKELKELIEGVKNVSFVRRGLLGQLAKLHMGGVHAFPPKYISCINLNHQFCCFLG